MLKRRADLTRSLLFLMVVILADRSVNCQVELTGSAENKTGTNESRSRIFSPRMDYDEWTPLGRGDPLKNDPTFDYVPPVLDRVQYWLDSHTTEPSAKRDILVLGVTAKKTSPKIPEQFLKFVDGPKFNRNPEQQYRNDHILNRNDFTGSSGAEPPKIMRNTNFRNGMVDFRNHNRIQNIPASYYPSPFYNQKPKPYTMMLPPPVAPKPVDAAQPTYTPQKEKMVYGDQSQQFSTQTEEGPVQTERHPYKNLPMNSYSQPHPPLRTMQSSLKPPPSKNNQISQIETINSVFTPPAQTTRQKFQSVTTPSVSFEKSNLVYQSTQTVSGGWLANGGASLETNHVTWQTPVKGQDHYDANDSQAAASSSHEVVIGQNANIIVDGENAENEEVVVGKKELPSRDNVMGPTAAPPTDVVQSSMFSAGDESDSSNIVVGQPSTSSSSSQTQMHIVVANTGPANTGFANLKPKESVAVIMPTNYMDKLNVTIGDSKNEPINVTRENNPNTMTSVIEQTIQISNPIPPPNSITNPPVPMLQMNHASQMNQAHQMNRINQANQANKMNHLPQMNPMNTMNQAPHHMHHFNQMNQINQIPTRSVFPPLPNAQPLIQHNPNPGHMMMSHLPNAGMRQPPGGMLSMPQQMFNGQLGHLIQQQQQQQHRPNVVEHNPPVYSVPHPVETLTTPGTEMLRDHPYHMQQVSNGAALNVPFLPTSEAPISKPETVTSSLYLVTDYIKNQSPLAHLLNNETNKPRPSTTTSTTTTTVSSLTTDPIFSHYKQPAKPIRGPMYLIIQGHSKVKTYKPSVNKHGVPVENNEIQEASTERPSKLEQFINENTRSRNLDKNTENSPLVVGDERPRNNRLEQEDLLSFVESNFSGFTVRPAATVEAERESNSVTSTEVNN